jgi:hypothetical protein
LITLLTITALPGCKKVVEKLFSGFDLALTDIPTAIPPIPVSHFPFYFSNTWDFNLDSLVRSESRGSFGSKDLTSVKVKGASLRLHNTDSVTNLADFFTISILLFSDTIRTPVTLVTANIPDTAYNTLVFDASNSPDILPYLQGTSITYAIRLTARRPTEKNLIAYTDVTLAIK